MYVLKWISYAILLKIGNGLNVFRLTLNTKYLPMRSKCWSLFSLRPAVFEIQGCRKSTWTEWPQTDLKHLNVKIILYTHISSTYHRGPNCGLCHSKTIHFWDTSYFYAPNNLKMTLNTAKSTVYILSTLIPPRTTKCGPFHSTTSQSKYKVVEH